ncbi:MAG TPA: MFS transporter, partial [Conexibacter sp.]|nr:MFS transporter [Conexibacter sp.]
MSAEPLGLRPRVRSGPRVVASLVLAALAYATMQMMVVPALPQIQRDLGVDAGATAWLVSAFLLSTTIATPVLGRVGDVYGKERVLVLVLAVFALGGLVGALAGSLPVLIVARVLQGLGGAVFPLAYGLARDALPRERVPLAIGLIAGSFGIGGSLGLVLCGPLVELASWHAIFWCGIALPLAAIVAVRAFVPPSPRRERVPLDWVGALGLAAALL